MNHCNLFSERGRTWAGAVWLVIAWVVGVLVASAFVGAVGGCTDAQMEQYLAEREQVRAEIKGAQAKKERIQKSLESLPSDLREDAIKAINDIDSGVTSLLKKEAQFSELIA